MAEMEIRSLDGDDFRKLYECFQEAFSDYFVRFNMSPEQFGRKLIRDGTDLRYTGAAFEDGRMLGFVMHGLDDWNGALTAYNGGTGVIPAARGRGITKAIYTHILPLIKAAGGRQALLEVLIPNEKAINVYQDLGYTMNRHFDCIRVHAEHIRKGKSVKDLSISAVPLPDWPLYQSFWDILPSWPCSIGALQRSQDAKMFVEAKLDGQTVGYGIIFKQTGSIAQIAVKPEYRKQGIGRAILNRLAQSSEAPSLSIINIDSRSAETLNFLYNSGFENSLAQYEMILPIE